MDCGRRFVRERKIIDGEESYLGEFPWMISVVGLNENRTALAHRCGAVILNKRWILTAAHCIHPDEGPSDFLIRIKSFKVYPEKESKLIVQKVIKVIKHKGFDQSYDFNDDIALMKVENDIEFDAFASPICLPESSFDAIGKTGIVAGWGVTKGDTSVLSPSLRKVELPIISISKCLTWFNDSGYSYVRVRNTELCAGYENKRKDSCHGDSGGPLFMKINDRYTIVGIVSHGIKCGHAKMPGIYTKVASYLTWIESTMRNN
ncbi:venom peptide isomerase heavy chain-like [Centruroides sculpturatus]|uniref:venom peptide isomerase heavy chain-like n=1 Tax=Centruroides sculpturatus TaxID=218467 RepID=UPI000C6ECE46|nr:venom peptide isomerase heavy chain-like [Centruroides sculpturatus]